LDHAAEGVSVLALVALDFVAQHAFMVALGAADLAAVIAVVATVVVEPGEVYWMSWMSG
jgi:hypothetical protein